MTNEQVPQVYRPEANKIFGFVPNLIGYGRVALTLIAMYLYKTAPLVATVCYVVSFLLDGLDGIAARALNQCSRVGAVLDMVTDRFSTAALVSVLGILYPDYIFFFVALNILDFVSHWARMYSSLVLGEGSHKNLNPNHGFLLNFYYGNKKFMAVCCVGNELFYVMLYVSYFFSLGAWFWPAFIVLLVPTWGMKQILNGIQLWAAAMDIANWEYEHEMMNKKK